MGPPRHEDLKKRSTGITKSTSNLRQSIHDTCQESFEQNRFAPICEIECYDTNQNNSSKSGSHPICGIESFGTCNVTRQASL